VVIVALCYHVCLSENNHYIPVYLDGFNVILFNQEYPHKSLNLYSIVSGNPLDSFPFDRLSYFRNLANLQNNPSGAYGKDQIFRLDLSAKAGSEAGDPLLNVFEGTARENRDHFSIMVTACNIPKTPTNLFFGYRYIDNYSDRFDRMWGTFQATNGKSMAFYDEGLVYEVTGGYTLRGSLASTGLKISGYRHWGATPFYFSPLYSSGLALHPTLFFNLPKSSLHGDFLFDYHKDYFDHIGFLDYTDQSWNIFWQRTLKKGVFAQISHHKNSRLKPATYTSATLRDTVSDLFILQLCGNLFGNLRMSSALDFSYIQLAPFFLNIKASWDYTPETRNYFFYENKKRVEYFHLEYESPNLHTAILYTDTIAGRKNGALRIPLSASVWMDYCGNPLWETVDDTGEVVIIRQDTIANAAHMTWGGRGACKVSLFNRVSINLWGNASILPEKRTLRFSLPLNAGTDIEYGKPDNDSIYAAIRFEYRDLTSIKYRMIYTEKVVDTVSPAHTGLSLLVQIPFHPPFFRKHLSTRIQIEAGPVRFAKEQRVRMHPMGNLIGPGISVGLNGYIR